MQNKSKITNSGNVRAGVVLVNKFCSPGDDKYEGYIDYVDRDEAIRNETTDRYNLYQEYMGNPLKTTGIFTDDKDKLTLNEKKIIKNCFKMAQKNKSIMWQTVISFDNRWLQENGLYDTITKNVNEKKLREVTRNCMRQILKEENLHAFWSAAIHYNTDNIHIHIATTEPYPTRKLKNYNGKMEAVGKFKLKSMEHGKSKIVNQIINESKDNQLINRIIRNNIIGSMKGLVLFEDSELGKDFLKIYTMLPQDKRKWKYNTNALNKVRPYIDNLSKKYINRYFPEDYKILYETMEHLEAIYSTAYGRGGKKENNFAENKLKDLYARLGNAILKSALEYSKKIVDMKHLDDIDFDAELVDMSTSVTRDKVTSGAKSSTKDEEISGAKSGTGYEEMAETENSTFQSLFDYAPYEQGKIYLDADQKYYEPDQDVLYLKASAEQGNQYAEYDLGKICLDEEGKYYEPDQGVLYLKASAEQGNQYAEYDLGKICLDEEGKYYEPDEGVLYLKASASQGNQHAQYALGKIYLDESQRYYHLDQGVQYLKASAEQGNEYAQYSLGIFYMDKGRKYYSVDNALEYLEPLAKAGNIYAQYKVGNLYYWNGNISIARQYWSDAAEKGLEAARNQLMYIEHKGGTDRICKVMGDALEYTLKRLRRTMKEEYKDCRKEYENLIRLNKKELERD